MRLTLAIDTGPDSDAEELSQLTALLRQHLLDLDVDAVELARSDAIPVGAKPVDAVTIGALVVTMAPSVLRSMVHLVGTWLQNRPVRGVTMTVDGDCLELTNASRADQHQLAEAFVAKHGRQ